MATKNPASKSPKSAPIKPVRRDTLAPRDIAIQNESEKRNLSKRRFVYDLVGLGMIAFGFIILGSLIAPSRVTSGDKGENFFGSLIVDNLRLIMGVGSWIFPFVLIISGTMLAVGRRRSLDNVGGAFMVWLVIITWWHLGNTAQANTFDPNAMKLFGGGIGAALAWALRAAIGNFGGHVMLFALMVVSIMWLCQISLHSIVVPLEAAVMQGGLSGIFANGMGVFGRRRRDYQNRREGGGSGSGARVSTGGVGGGTAEQPDEEVFEDETAPLEDPDRTRKLRARKGFRQAIAEVLQGSGVRESGNGAAEAATTGGSRRNAAASGGGGGNASTRRRHSPANGSSVQAAAGEGEDFENEESAVSSADGAAKRGATAAAANKPRPSADGEDEWKLPPFSLLKPAAPGQAARQGQNDRLREETLIKTLEEFNIGADVDNVVHGPAITRYEIKLDPGIKVSKIVSLADNLAMSLAAMDVRIEAPIPGKSAIGIEVPNENPVMVTLREVIQEAEFQNASSKLTIALGKDVEGKARYADLTKMPHLLIGGTTGSGKSVCLNTIVCSLLYRATPDEVKFLMIDPKKVELSLYQDIPHLVAPVITDVKQAPLIFKQALREMEMRYDKFAKIGTRNIEGFNQKVGPEDKLPYWVLIVDELADLMMQSGPEIEAGICRLAQLSRATGIHLIIATQRPSVNVITGTIKANISSRIAFAVNSLVDSRTILDMAGAERLIGRGDMLFMPLDAAKPLRIQGCFVSDRETEDIVEYWKKQGEAEYSLKGVDIVLQQQEAEDNAKHAATTGSDDDLFEQAVKLVVTNGNASTSMLQRRFKIGYGRAAGLIDVMEERGIVGPRDTSNKAREILMTRDSVDAMFASGRPL